MHVVVQKHLKKPCIVIMNEHITQSGDDYEISNIILVHMKCGQGYIIWGIGNMRQKILLWKLCWGLNVLALLSDCMIHGNEHMGGGILN
jgi:hypothetical protein